jgi:fumarate hydratase class II
MEEIRYRVEKDSMGEVFVPYDAYWGAQTQRAIQNFKFSPYRMPEIIIRSIALVKYAAAHVNGELGLIPEEYAKFIKLAAEGIMYSPRMSDFPVDVFQTGSGTSTNMNVNEVIATRANELMTGEKKTTSPIHPNDHVNKCQSSNDVIPSAIRIATAIEIETNLLPKLNVLRETISKKAHQLRNIIKTGRTHLMDAMPISFAQEFSGWEKQIEYGIERLRSTYPRLLELPLGGTAVGTGINAHPEFAERVVNLISQISGIQFKVAANRFEAQASIDVASEVSGALKTLAASLMKISNDIRLMNSGPLSGMGEITIPALQPGSSIMPAKVNPVIPEAVRMASAKVIGNDTTITISCSLGEFELNTMLPVIGFCLIESITLMANSAYLLAKKVINGIKVNQEKVKRVLEQNPIVATILSPVIGYEQAAKLIKRAIEENKTIREVLKETKIIPEDKIDEYLDFKKMI